MACVVAWSVESAIGVTPKKSVLKSHLTHIIDMTGRATLGSEDVLLTFCDDESDQA